jgi:anti-sigma B factor antagonist
MSSIRNEELKIATSDRPSGARLLQLSGPLTLSTLFDFQEVVRQDRTKSLLLDVSEVPYMDSAGLGSIISAFVSCQSSHRAFGLFGISDRIQQLLDVTRVSGLMPCFASLEEAEAKLGLPAT